MSLIRVEFPGFDREVAPLVMARRAQIPPRIYSLDGKRFVAVDLERMVLDGDGSGEVSEVARQN